MFTNLQVTKNIFVDGEYVPTDLRGLFEFMCANSELLSTSDIHYILHANEKVLKEFKLRQVDGLWSCCQQATCRFSEVWNRLNSSSSKSITDVKFSANCRPFNAVKSNMAWDTVSPKNAKKNLVQVHSYMPVLSNTGLFRVHNLVHKWGQHEKVHEN